MDRGELRAWRTGAGLTQRELAMALGVHPLTVSKWERGQHPIPVWVEYCAPALVERWRYRVALT